MTDILGGGSTPPGGGVPPGSSKKSLDDTAKAARDASSAFEQQIKILSDLKSSYEAVERNLENFRRKSKVAFTDDEIKKLAKAAEKLQKEGKKLDGTANDLSKTFKKVSTVSVTAAAALDGLYQSFKNLYSLLRGGAGLLSTIVGVVWDLASAIAAVPIKAMESLFGTASERGHAQEYAEALQEVVKQFGDLGGKSSRTVTTLSSSMAGFSATGLDVTLTFGNIAERLKKVNELMASLGPLFRSFAGEMVKAGGAIMGFQKAFDISNDDVETIASRSKVAGVSMVKTFIDITKQSLAMAKAFDLDAKVLQRDMVKAMKDVAHFGHLSSKELAVAVAYANKLGVSIDKLTGLMDSFDTFDQAAENVARLNETFQTNIDLDKIMGATDPASRAQILQQEFARAGKDITKMNIAERKYIASLTGVDAATLDLILSGQKQEDQMEKMRKEAEKTAKITMDQTAAMKALAKSIDQTVPKVDKFHSLWEDMVNGFKEGIFMNPAMINLMNTIDMFMRDVNMGMRRLGQVFVNTFPGVMKMIKSLTEMFNPHKFMELVNKVVDAFDYLSWGGKHAVDDFIKTVKDGFKEFFGTSGSDFIDGLREFSGTVIKIFSGISVSVIDWLAEMIPKVIEFIKNPDLSSLKGGTESDKWIAILEPLKDVWKHLKETLWPEVKKGLIALGELILEKLGEVWKELPWKYKLGAALYLLAPVITRTLAAFVSSVLLNRAINSGLAKLGDKITGSATSTIADAAKKAASGAPGGSVDSVFSTIPEPKTIDKMETAANSKVEWQKLARFLVGLAGVITIGLVGFYAAVKMFKDFSSEDLLKGAASMLIGLGAMAAAGALAKEAELIKIDPAKASMGLAAMAVVLATAAVAIASIVGFLGNTDPGQLKRATDAMIVGGVAMAAAGALAVEAALVGMVVANTGGTAVVGLVAMGVVLAAVGLAAAAMQKFGEKVDVPKITNAAEGMKIAGIALAAAGLLAAEASVVGLVVVGTMGAIIPGMIAMVKVLEAVGETAKSMVEQLGDISLASVTKVGDIISGMVPLFAGAGLALPAMAAAGAVAITMGIPALAGFHAMKTTLSSVADVAIDLVQLLQPVDLASFVSSAAIISVMSDTFKKIGDVISTTLSLPGLSFTGLSMKMFDVLRDATRLLGKAAIEVIEMLGAVSITGDMEGKATAFSTVFSALVGVTSTFDRLGNLNDFVKKVSEAAITLSRLVKVPSFGTTAPPLVELFQSFNDVSTLLAAQASAMGITSIPMAAGIRKTLSAVQDMVSAVQDTDDALSKLQKIDLKTRLGTVANAVGLGSSGVYTVKSKEVVINVAFNVTMDVGQMEQILITRQNSIIRDRINFAIAAGSGQLSSDDANSGKYENAIVRGSGINTGLPGAAYGL